MSKSLFPLFITRCADGRSAEARLPIVALVGNDLLHELLVHLH